MLKLLKTRIVLIERLPLQLKFMGAVTLYVFIFVLAYKPFSVDNYSFKIQSCIACLYSAIVFLVPVMFILLRHFIKIPFFDKDKWTIGKELLYSAIMVIPITILFFVVDALHHSVEYNIWGFIDTLKKVFLLSILPIIILLIVKKNMWLENNIGKLIKPDLQAYPNQLVADTRISTSNLRNPNLTVQIHSNNKSESFLMIATDFLFAISERNYIDIHFMKNGVAQKKTIRSTLKQLQTDFENTPFIIKCHRSYLINTNKITSFKGNSRGYKISFDADLPTIPVGRTYIDDLKKILPSNK